MSTLVSALGQRKALVGAADETQAHQPQANFVDPTSPGVQPHANLVGGPGRSEAIDWVNDPTRFGVSLEMRIDRLPLTGKAKERPWADTYWPTYQDAVNARWQSTGDFKNDLSPAEKFDAAFNGWDPQKVAGKQPYKAEWGSYDKPGDETYYANLGPFASYVSNFRGNKTTRDAAKAGKLNSDGTAKSGNEKEDFGGIQTWWGLCHAWAPAAIREKEPLHAVEHNGIKFEVSDIKALLIACYSQPRSVLIGGRNEERPNEVSLDANGRPKTSNMRDINPGTMHVLLANMLGIRGESFVEDRTGHFEVWNQPIAEFRVTKMDPISEADAARLVKDADSEYDYNTTASKFFHVKAEVDYITESHASTTPNAHNEGQERTDPYEYILECDANGKILGGEWLGSSRTQHPDFLWYPNADGGGTLAPNISLEQVRVLLEKSRAGGGGGGGGGNAINVVTEATLRQGQTKALDPIRVAADGVLEFTQTGSGDVDVYVKKNGTPTFSPDGRPLSTDMFLYEAGSNERKTLNVKAGDVVSVVMRGYDANSTSKLAIKTLS